MKPSELLAAAPTLSEPVPVYTGPTRTGAALIAALAADADKQTVRRRGKKSHVAAGKSDAADSKTRDGSKEAKSEGKSDTKAAAPTAVRHAAAKPAATGEQATKPAKPKTASKPESKPDSNTAAKPAKPASKPASEPKPAS